jgi:hypothetical protein
LPPPFLSNVEAKWNQLLRDFCVVPHRERDRETFWNCPLVVKGKDMFAIILVRLCFCENQHSPICVTAKLNCMSYASTWQRFVPHGHNFKNVVLWKCTSRSSYCAFGAITSIHKYKLRKFVNGVVSKNWIHKLVC